MSATVSRDVAGDGAVSDSIGGTEPLDLEAIAALIGGERDQCYNASAAFQALVEEHTRAIAPLADGSGSPAN